MFVIQNDTWESFFLLFEGVISMNSEDIRCSLLFTYQCTEIFYMPRLSTGTFAYVRLNMAATVTSHWLHCIPTPQSQFLYHALRSKWNERGKHKLFSPFFSSFLFSFFFFPIFFSFIHSLSIYLIFTSMFSFSFSFFDIHLYFFCLSFSLSLVSILVIFFFFFSFFYYLNLNFFFIFHHFFYVFLTHY